MGDLAGSVAVVTGGASGIGRAAALAFADAGADVVIGDVDAAGCRETASTVEAAGVGARAVEADVTADDDVAGLIETASDAFGGVDAAFNNAGVPSNRTAIADSPEDAWRRVIDVNLTGVWRCLKHELREMSDDGGAIVNNASVFGRVGFPGSGGYVAAKHGVIGLTKAAALEYADDGIRVNAVCPGFIDTRFIDDGGIVGDDDERARIEASHPLGRLGTPDEVAAAARWLCSDAASFVTGTAVPVDGGYLAR